MYNYFAVCTYLKTVRETTSPCDALFHLPSHQILSCQPTITEPTTSSLWMPFAALLMRAHRKALFGEIVRVQTVCP